MAWLNEGDTRKWVHKFGENSDVDTADVPEDVWSVGGLVPWPLTAAETTIVSTDAEVGGAIDCRVSGLLTGWVEAEEDAVLDGTTPVVLVNEFIRVNRIQVLTSGVNGPNIGNIQVKHDTSVLAQVDVGMGQTLMAAWTAPDNYTYVNLTKWWVTATNSIQGAVIKVALLTRPSGGSWNVKMTALFRAQANSEFSHIFEGGLELTPGTDVRVTVLSTSSNTSTVSSGFTVSKK